MGHSSKKSNNLLALPNNDSNRVLKCLRVAGTRVGLLPLQVQYDENVI
jgi:hypothetical protein